MTESSTSYNTGTGGDGGYTYQAVPEGYGSAGYPLGDSYVAPEGSGYSTSPVVSQSVPDGYGTNGYGTGGYNLDPGSYGTGYVPGDTGGSTVYPAVVDGVVTGSYGTGYVPGDTGGSTVYPAVVDGAVTGSYGTGYVPSSGTYGTVPSTGYGSGMYGTNLDAGTGTTGTGATDSPPVSSPTTDSGTPSGDYTDCTWKQVMKYVTGYDPDDPSVNGTLTSSPQSMQDAADAFWYTGQVLKEAGENLGYQVDALTGENGSWQGTAAQSFGNVMKSLSQQVANLSDVLTGGITGDYNVPQQLADDAQHLRDAINKLMDIDNWYAQQAIDYYNSHPGEFSNDLYMDNGQIAVSQVKAIPPMMDSDMRQVLITLAGHYKVTIDQVPDVAFSNPVTGGGGGLSDPLVSRTAPMSSYGATAPVSSYGATAPVSSYGATAPVSSYGATAPVSSYGATAPVSSYGATAPMLPYGPTVPMLPSVAMMPSTEGGTTGWTRRTEPHLMRRSEMIPEQSANCDGAPMTAPCVEAVDVSTPQVPAEPLARDVPVQHLSERTAKVPEELESREAPAQHLSERSVEVPAEPASYADRTAKVPEELMLREAPAQDATPHSDSSSSAGDGGLPGF